MHPVVLVSDRLILSPITWEDSNAVYFYCRRPEMKNFFPLPYPYLLTDAVNWVKDREEQWSNFSSAARLTFGVRDKTSKKFLGVIEWRPEDKSVGYWLGQENRGNGYMVEALNLLAGWIFDVLEEEEIMWACYAGNYASALTAYKVGFRFQGFSEKHYVMNPPGQQSAWTAVLKPEWFGKPEEPLWEVFFNMPVKM